MSVNWGVIALVLFLALLSCWFGIWKPGMGRNGGME